MGKKPWIIVSVGLVITCFIIISGLYIIDYRRKQADLSVRLELLNQVVDLAESVSPENVRRLSFTASDSNSHDYKRIRQQLMDYGSMIYQRGIYTMALKNDKIVFGPENYLEDDPMGAGPPGTVYENPIPDDFIIFRTGQPFVAGPITDEYGEFISSSAPVMDPENGNVLMVIGIDILADEWEKAMFHAVFPPALAMIVVVTMILVGLVITLVRRKLNPSAQFKLRHLETFLVAIIGLLITGYFVYLSYDASVSQRQSVFNQQSQGKIESIRDRLAMIKQKISNFTDIVHLYPTFTASNLQKIKEVVYYKMDILSVSCIERSGSGGFKQILGTDSVSQHSEQLTSYIFNLPEFVDLSGQVSNSGITSGIVISFSEKGTDTIPYAVLLSQTGHPEVALNGEGMNNPQRFILSLIRLDLLVNRQGNDFGFDHKYIETNIYQLGIQKNSINSKELPGYKSFTQKLIPADLNTTYSVKKITPLFLDGCNFSLVLTPSDLFLNDFQVNTTWLAMIFGLLVTVVLTLFVRYIRNQQFNLKEAVAMQTAELNNHLVELTEAKRQVEQSDKLKTAFLNNISHEVRTPLNGILGFTSMLVHDEIPVNEREEFISMIRESANRLTHTITNYMDISLLVTKNYKVTKKPVNLFQVLCGTIAMFKHACSLKKLLLVSEVDISDRELVLNTDKDLLEKILMHLVDNAVKFTSSGKIVVGFKTSETLVTFFIRDTGSGISKAAQQRIFEVFMQEDISHTRGYEGSGLGLSISHESVQLLGGTIAVKSEKGEGSEFSFTLPLVHPDARKEQPATGTGSPEAISITILIAEDESANGLFLQKSLTKAGYHSILVTDGKQAVEAVKKNPEISLVLMDIKMPVMDGYEASRLIKSIRSDLVIIAISAYDLAGDEVRALEAGCDDYIIKPVNRDLLFRIISRFIK